MEVRLCNDFRERAYRQARIALLCRRATDGASVFLLGQIISDDIHFEANFAKLLSAGDGIPRERLPGSLLRFRSDYGQLDWI